MNDTKRREFHRVDDLLPFQYRRIQVEDYDLLQKKYLSGTICEIGLFSGPSAINEQNIDIGESENVQAIKDLLSDVMKYLHTIDMKLDHIMKRLEGEQDETLLFKHAEHINISGSGAAFLADGNLNVDDILEIRILQPGWPFKVIPALGKVVRVMPTEETGKVEIAVHFTAISENSRDQLTKYIFRLERGLLRSKAVGKLA